MRDYVQGKVPRPTSETRVFYWLHDGPSIGLLRGVGMPAVRGRFDEFGLFSIMKVPPLGFMVTNLPAYEGLPQLVPPSTSSADPSMVRFWRSLRQDADWPERVDDGNVLLGGAYRRRVPSGRAHCSTMEEARTLPVQVGRAGSVQDAQIVFRRAYDAIQTPHRGLKGDRRHRSRLHDRARSRHRAPASRRRGTRACPQLSGPRDRGQSPSPCRHP